MLHVCIKITPVRLSRWIAAGFPLAADAAGAATPELHSTPAPEELSGAPSTKRGRVSVRMPRAALRVGARLLRLLHSAVTHHTDGVRGESQGTARERLQVINSFIGCAGVTAPAPPEDRERESRPGAPLHRHHRQKDPPSPSIHSAPIFLNEASSSADLPSTAACRSATAHPARPAEAAEVVGGVVSTRSRARQFSFLPSAPPPLA